MPSCNGCFHAAADVQSKNLDDDVEGPRELPTILIGVNRALQFAVGLGTFAFGAGHDLLDGAFLSDRDDVHAIAKFTR